MKLAHIFASSLAMILFAGNSCKKTEGTSNLDGCTVKTATDNDYQYVFEYDNYGRLSRQKLYNLFGAPGDEVSFEYSVGRCVINLLAGTSDTIQLTNAGLYASYYVTNYDSYCYFNPKNQIDSIAVRTGNKTRLLFTCSYNASGDLMELTAYDTYHIWYRKAFTYTSEINYINYCPETLFWTGGWGPSSIENFRFHSKQFYGNTVSKHLPLSINHWQYDYNTGSVTNQTSTSYSYAKDNEGRVITISGDHLPNSYTTTIQLEYDCTK